MRLLDLFSGIGGFSLATEWVWGEDLEIVGFCEIDKYCQKVLAKNFPGVPIYEDITKLSGEAFKDIDLITGGFPCQDISVAGKGAGITGKRSGLWSEMHRLIGEIRPRYALIENVPMLTVRGGTRVISDLAEIGYDCEWQIVGADDVGAWHRRKRIWIVAYPSYVRSPQTEQKRKNKIKSRRQIKIRDGIAGLCYNVPDTGNQRLQRSEKTGNNGKNRQKLGYKFSTRYNRGREYWAVEPDVGRVAHGIPKRVDRLKGLGNAIVPQVAQVIMDRIKAVA